MGAKSNKVRYRSSLARNGGNRRAVSAELGIARSSLLRKLDLLGLRTGAEQA